MYRNRFLLYTLFIIYQLKSELKTGIFSPKSWKSENGKRIRAAIRAISTALLFPLKRYPRFRRVVFTDCVRNKRDSEYSFTSVLPIAGIGSYLIPLLIISPASELISALSVPGWANPDWYPRLFQSSPWYFSPGWVKLVRSCASAESCLGIREKCASV